MSEKLGADVVLMEEAFITVVSLKSSCPRDVEDDAVPETESQLPGEPHPSLWSAHARH